MKKKEEKQKEERNLLKRNIKFLFKKTLKNGKKIFYYFGVVTIITAILPFIEVLIPKLLIDELTVLKRPKTLAIILVSFLVVSATLKFLASYVRGKADAKMLEIRMNFMNEVQRKIILMDFKKTESKDFLNQMENVFNKSFGGDHIGVGAIFHRIFEMGGTLISFLGYSTIIFTLHPLILLYLVFNVVVIYYLVNKVRKYEYSKRDDIAQNNRKKYYLHDVTYNFSYGKDIRVFNFREFLKNKYRGVLDEGLNIRNDIETKNFKTALISIILLLIREGLAYAYLVYSVIYKDMTIGNFTLYFATIAGFARFMEIILDCISDINTQSLYMSEYVDFMLESEEEETEITREIPKDKTYEIEFKNVSFKYPNSERYIMKNLSLKISKGQRIAIVGVNGAGKTTFIKLLTRLYDPTEGEILINGINIKEFKKKDYFKLFSVVFQEINIFAFSVEKNITLLSEEYIEKDRVEKAIDEAGMTEKINSLNKGMETSLLKIMDDEGVELSGGENQRLALARALYKNGEIVILDEPTAALDAIAEYNIYTRFNEMIGEKTAIYISHRLSSTKFCDVIAFFEDGEIKEYGTHEELLNKNGRYSEMFNVQASYYQKNEEGDLIAN